MSANNSFLPVKTRFLIVMLGALLFYFPCFLRLDSKPLREWDEARNAINAWEMSHTGELIVKTYKGEPDLWETKPPLLVWLQALGFRIFGTGELAVRLPSALSAFALGLVMMFWFGKVLNSYLSGLAAGLITLSSEGFIHDHAARTGDHDAMLVFFSVLMLLNFFMWLEDKRSSHLYRTVLFLILAVLTKSVAVLMFFPGLLLYTWLTGQLRSVLSDRRTWAGIAAFLIPVSAYYLYREQRSPGYLEAVWHNELFPRYTNTSDRYRYNVSDYWYYLRELGTWQYRYWIIFLIPATLINFISGEGITKRLHLFLFCNALVYWLVISSGSTNFWYDLPLIPLFSMMIAISFHHLFRFITKSPRMGKASRILPVLFFAAVFFVPYKGILRKVSDMNEHSAQVMYGYAFREIRENLPAIKDVAIYDPLGYNYPLVFYRMVYEKEHGMRFTDRPAGPLQHFSGDLLILEEQLKNAGDSVPPHTVLLSRPMYRLIRFTSAGERK